MYVFMCVGVCVGVCVSRDPFLKLGATLNMLAMFILSLYFVGIYGCLHQTCNWLALFVCTVVLNGE